MHVEAGGQLQPQVLFPRLYAPVYVWVWGVLSVCMCVYLCVYMPEDNLRGHFSGTTLLLLLRHYLSLTLILSNRLGWFTSQPQSPRDLPVSLFPALGLQTCVTMSFSVSCGNQFRSLCLVGKNLTELTPQPLKLFFETRFDM